MRFVGHPSHVARLLAVIFALGLAACDTVDGSLPEVTRAPSGLECYPVNYLRPPYPPPSVDCPLPRQGQDVMMVLLIGKDGEVFDAYLPGEESPSVEACVLREARTRGFDPARECDGTPVVSQVRLKYSDMFGRRCLLVECGRTTR